MTYLKYVQVFSMFSLFTEQAEMLAKLVLGKVLPICTTFIELSLFREFVGPPSLAVIQPNRTEVDMASDGILAGEVGDALRNSSSPGVSDSTTMFLEE